MAPGTSGTGRLHGRAVIGLERADEVIDVVDAFLGQYPFEVVHETDGSERIEETDAVGDYRFERLQEGAAYLLYVRAPGYEGASGKEGTPGDGPVNFVLAPLPPGVPVEPTE